MYPAEGWHAKLNSSRSLGARFWMDSSGDFGRLFSARGIFHQSQLPKVNPSSASISDSVSPRSVEVDEV